MQTPRKFKYIIVEDAFGNETPIIFPEHIEHGALIESFPHIVSAGFADITLIDNKQMAVSCFGESTSLKLKSRTNDCKLIHKLFTKEI